jgi:phosphoribosylamine--glycine ligase
MESDLAELMIASLEGGIGDVRLQWRPEMAVDVVLASEGYPESPRKGVPIAGVDAANGVPDVIVFHAGTARQDGGLVTAGGRVLNIVGMGSDAAAARARCYEAVSKIEFPGMQYRTDIAAGLP